MDWPVSVCVERMSRVFIDATGPRPLWATSSPVQGIPGYVRKPEKHEPKQASRKCSSMVSASRDSRY